MRKIIAITSILVLLAIFTPRNITSMNDTWAIEQPIISAINITDLTAPTIVLNVSLYNTTGVLSGSIIETESNIHNYTILLNGTNLNSLVATQINTKLVTFTLDANTYFNDIIGFHNYLEIIAFNDAVSPSPLPSLKQGGGGGGGGFFFCDDQDCWGPIPLQPDYSYKESFGTNADINDTTAPFSYFDLTEFPCCGNITHLNTTDPDTGVASNTTDITLDTLSFWSQNNEGVSMKINITWAVPTPVIPTTPPTTKTSYFVFSGFVFISLIAISVKRKKYRT